MHQIHPTAVVHPSARIGDEVTIGPYTTVEAGVEIGPGSIIGAYVTLGERLVLGSGVQVFNYACLGTASQDKKHRGEISHAEIGDGSIVREFVTVNRATREGGVTRVGRNVLLMAYAHVAHECEVGDHAVLVNAATLGGEVEIGPGAVISGLACIHQFCRVGQYAIVGASSKVTLDIPPFVVADGHPARPFGPNRIGLKRHGYTEEDILEIRRIYRHLFNRKRRFTENMSRVAEHFGSTPSADTILAFCRSSRRGVARPRLRPGAAEASSDAFEAEFGATAL